MLVKGQEERRDVVNRVPALPGLFICLADGILQSSLGARLQQDDRQKPRHDEAAREEGGRFGGEIRKQGRRSECSLTEWR